MKDLVEKLKRWFPWPWRPQPRPTPVPTPTPQPVPTPEPVPVPQDVAAALVLLHNNERAAAGVGLLTIDSKLTAAAKKHADWMAANNRLDHNEGSSTVGDRARAEGYRFSTLGENIAMGYSTPEAVVAGWMKSSGHKQNILNPRFRNAGFAKSGNYWCVVLGASFNTALVSKHKVIVIPPGIKE